jgi:hypothetical protein
MHVVPEQTWGRLMAYIVGAAQRIRGVDYAKGDSVPLEVINSMKIGVVNNLVSRGRLRFVDELETPSVPAEPPIKPVEWTYKGSGWWEAPNGIKTRGPADRPPVLTGA